MSLSKRRKHAIISVIIAAILVLTYTYYSNRTEPHPMSPSTITSRAYAAEIANGTGGDPSSLFFHTFNLSGSNATFGFSWSISSETYEYFGPDNHGANGMGFYFTKINQSMGFPYFGTFILQPVTSNVSITFNNTTYFSIEGQPNYLAFPPYPVNSSVSGYYYLYFPPISFTTEMNNPMSNSSYGNYYIPYVSSYNVTYRIEINPIVEFGPYYIIGSPVWISHTYTYPYS